SAVKAKAGKIIDLNKATAKEMEETLPGVGEVTAKKIVAGRPYGSVDDLAKAGVPARTINAIRALGRVGPATATAPTTATTTAKPAAAPKTATIPAKPAAAPKAAVSKSAAPAAPVNLNTATVAELETLPGVGPAYAKAIVANRPYKSVDDLARVKGLSKS